MIGIRYICDLNNGTGYNNAARGMIRSLEHLGYDQNNLRIIPAIMSGMCNNDINSNDWLMKYTSPPWDADKNQPINELDPGINIVHLNPGMTRIYHTSYNSMYNIVYTAWETDSLPRKEFDVNGIKQTIVDDLNMYDEIWVPSSFVRSVFINCGVEKPIFIIPHSLQPEILDSLDKNIINHDDDIRFYYVGSFNDVKAVDRLIHAYYNTRWGPEKNVTLHLHLTPPSREKRVVIEHGHYAMQKMKELKNAHGGLTPRITYCLRPISYDEIVDIHRKNHIFVTMSRAEGFCLPIQEAIAMGSWVIGGGGPAVRDFINYHDLNIGSGIPSLSFEDGGPLELLPYRKNQIIPMPDRMGYELDQKWFECDVSDMTEAMKTAYHDLLSLSSTGDAFTDNAFSNLFKNAYSYKNIANKIKQRLEHAEKIVHNSGW